MTVTRPDVVQVALEGDTAFREKRFDPGGGAFLLFAEGFDGDQGFEEMDGFVI